MACTLPEKNMRAGFLFSFWCRLSSSGKAGRGCKHIPVMTWCQIPPHSKVCRCSYWNKTPPCAQEPNGPFSTYFCYVFALQLLLQVKQAAASEGLGSPLPGVRSLASSKPRDVIMCFCFTAGTKRDLCGVCVPQLEVLLQTRG